MDKVIWKSLKKISCKRNIKKGFEVERRYLEFDLEVDLKFNNVLRVLNKVCFIRMLIVIFSRGKGF